MHVMLPCWSRLLTLKCLFYCLAPYFVGLGGTLGGELGWDHTGEMGEGKSVHNLNS